MAPFDFSVRQYPWLASFDTAPNNDDRITDNDVDAWLLASSNTSSLASSASPELKRDLFVIEQTSNEAHFKLLLLGMRQSSIDHLNSEFVGPGLKIINEYKQRLDQLGAPAGNTGTLTNIERHNRAVQRELLDLDGLWHRFAGEKDFGGAVHMYSHFGGGIGIALDFHGAHVFIKDLLKTGPAQKTGLKPGDEILRVDGGPIQIFMPRDASSADPEDKQVNIDSVRGALMGPPHSKLELVIERRGREKTFVIPRDFNMFPALFSPENAAFPVQYDAEYHKPEYQTASLLHPYVPPTYGH